MPLPTLFIACAARFKEDNILGSDSSRLDAASQALAAANFSVCDRYFLERSVAFRCKDLRFVDVFELYICSSCFIRHAWDNSE